MLSNKKEKTRTIRLLPNPSLKMLELKPSPKSSWRLMQASVARRSVTTSTNSSSSSSTDGPTIRSIRSRICSSTPQTSTPTNSFPTMSTCSRWLKRPIHTSFNSSETLIIQRLPKASLAKTNQLILTLKWTVRIDAALQEAVCPGRISIKVS